MINLYWWNKRPNIGDYFGNWLLQKLNFNSNYCSENPDLAICGSILEHTQIKDTTKIWGCGFHMGNSRPGKTDATPNNIYALRGIYSKNQLGITKNIALGDPGILLSKFCNPKHTHKHKIGIVSHFLDSDYINNAYGNKYKIISTSTENVEHFAKELVSCDFIFSTSLHGIIFSHSLGIPAIHLEINNVGSADNFKFKDYFSVLDIDYIKITEEAIKDKILDPKKYLPSRKCITKIQNNLLKAFPYKLPTVALCAIAKNENKYLREWVEHHLNLNIDQIYLLDNNDPDGEHFEEVIGDYIKNKKVIVIDKRGIRNAQIDSYEEFYQTIGQKYDWVGFWDIDEFLFLDEDTNIQNFIVSPRFENFNTIMINWKYFDDNNYITVKNNNYNVVNRFTNPAVNSGKENTFGKRLIKTKIDGIHINSSHGPINRISQSEIKYSKYLTNNTVKCANSAGEDAGYNGCHISYPTHKYAHLRHFRFKTLEEYVTNKMKRGYPTLYKNEGKDLNLTDFFLLNEITPEKIQWLKDNNIEVDLELIQKIKTEAKYINIDDIKAKPEPKKEEKVADGKAGFYLYF